MISHTGITVAEAAAVINVAKLLGTRKGHVMFGH